MKNPNKSHKISSFFSNKWSNPQSRYHIKQLRFNFTVLSIPTLKFQTKLQAFHFHPQEKFTLFLFPKLSTEPNTIERIEMEERTWNSWSPARAWKADSSSERAYIRVSGTYFPPNLPKRPNESGRWSGVEDPLSSIRSSGGSRVEIVQEIASEEAEG